MLLSSPVAPIPIASLEPKKDRTEGDKALEAGLAAKLGELARRDVAPRTLLELEQVARLGRELLAVSASPQAFGPQLGLNAPQAYGTMGFAGQYAGVASNPETFGAHAIRELIGKAATPKRDAVELVKAIAEAKERKLEKVAAALERELLGLDADALQPAAEGAAGDRAIEVSGVAVEPHDPACTCKLLDVLAATPATDCTVHGLHQTEPAPATAAAEKEVA